LPFIAEIMARIPHLSLARIFVEIHDDDSEELVVY
jgi:hypothetical protein